MFYKIINRKKRYATKVADALGSLLYLPRTLLRRHREIAPEKITSILIIRTAYIGDVMMTIPMLRPLRLQFPEAHVSFLTSTPAAELLRGNPDLDEVICFEPFWFYQSAYKSSYLQFLRSVGRRRFDLVIETRGDIREILLLVRPFKAKFKVSYGVGGGAYMLSHVVPYPGLKHKVEYHLDICRYLNCPVNKVEWGVHLSAEERKRVEQILCDSGLNGPFLAAHPGSRLVLKRWLKARYAELFDRISVTTGLPVILLGAPAETPLVNEIAAHMKQTPVNLSGKLDLRQMAGVLARARAFVCNDSAPMHVAAAVDTPTVALFGPSKSVETAPFGSIHRVVERKMPCRSTCDESNCLHTDRHACMRSISVDQALSVVAEMLNDLCLAD